MKQSQIKLTKAHARKVLCIFGMLLICNAYGRDCSADADQQKITGQYRAIFIEECLKTAKKSSGDPDQPAAVPPAAVPAVLNSANDIEEDTDRFTGAITIKSKLNPVMDRKLHPQIIALLGPGGDTQETAVILSGAFDGWKYLSCNDTHWLGDGKRFDLQKVTHNGDVISGGMVVEHIMQPIGSASEFRRLAGYSKLEFKVCNDEFEFTAQDMQNLKEIASKLKK